MSSSSSSTPSLLLSRLHRVELQSCLHFCALRDLLSFAASSRLCTIAVSHPHVWLQWERQKRCVRIKYRTAVRETQPIQNDKEKEKVIEEDQTLSPILRLLTLAPLSLKLRDVLHDHDSDRDDRDNDNNENDAQLMRLLQSSLFSRVRQLEIELFMFNHRSNINNHKEIIRLLSHTDTPFRRSLHTLRIRTSQPRETDVPQEEEDHEHDEKIDQMVDEWIRALTEREGEGKGSALTSLHIGMMQARLTDEQAHLLCKLTNLTHLSFDTSLPLSGFDILCASPFFQHNLRSLGLLSTTNKFSDPSQLSPYEGPLCRLTSLTALHVESQTLSHFANRLRPLTQLRHLLITHRVIADCEEILPEYDMIEAEMPNITELTFHLTGWRWIMCGSPPLRFYERADSKTYEFRKIQSELKERKKGRLSVCLQKHPIVDRYEKLHTYNLFTKEPKKNK